MSALKGDAHDTNRLYSNCSMLARKLVTLLTPMTTLQRTGYVLIRTPKLFKYYFLFTVNDKNNSLL